jgi:hypothetical protein
VVRISVYARSRVLMRHRPCRQHRRRTVRASFRRGRVVVVMPVRDAHNAAILAGCRTNDAARPERGVVGPVDFAARHHAAGSASSAGVSLTGAP